MLAVSWFVSCFLSCWDIDRSSYWSMLDRSWNWQILIVLHSVAITCPVVFSSSVTLPLSGKHIPCLPDSTVFTSCVDGDDTSFFLLMLVFLGLRCCLSSVFSGCFPFFLFSFFLTIFWDMCFQRVTGQVILRDSARFFFICSPQSLTECIMGAVFPASLWSWIVCSFFWECLGKPGLTLHCRKPLGYLHSWFSGET